MVEIKTDLGYILTGKEKELFLAPTISKLLMHKPDLKVFFLKILQYITKSEFFREAYNSARETYFKKIFKINEYVEADGMKFFLTNPSIGFLISNIIGNNQYLLDRRIQGGVVVDAGANIGVFSIYAVKVWGAKKVYAFEPVSGTYDILCKNIKMNGLEKIVIPIKKALGYVQGKDVIKYSIAGDDGATFLESSTEYREEVEIVCLDAEIKEPICFIKIDTEGYEKEVLFGAKKTIVKYKPILSFSAYHRPKDKIELPLVVKDIDKRYKCKLINLGEEDFYCESV